MPHLAAELIHEFVDVRRRSSGEDPRLEAVLSRAAGIIDSLARRDDATTLVLVGSNVEFHGQDVFQRRDELLTPLAEVKGATRQLDWEDAWDDILSTVEPESGLVVVVDCENQNARRSLAQARIQERQPIELTVDS